MQAGLVSRTQTWTWDAAYQAGYKQSCWEAGFLLQDPGKAVVREACQCDRGLLQATIFASRLEEIFRKSPQSQPR